MVLTNKHKTDIVHALKLGKPFAVPLKIMKVFSLEILPFMIFSTNKGKCLQACMHSSSQKNHKILLFHVIHPIAY